jgi:hypothetical protein
VQNIQPRNEKNYMLKKLNNSKYCTFLYSASIHFFSGGFEYIEARANKKE